MTKILLKKRVQVCAITLREIGEPLRTEKAEITVDVEFSDLTFRLENGNGLHLEYEADLSEPDLLRFCGYHVDLIQTYGMAFHTVIFTRKKPKHTMLDYEELTFAPKVVSCDMFDGDQIITDLGNKIALGQPVNELFLIYLPFFKSANLKPAELLRKAVSLAQNLKTESIAKDKLLALMLVLANKIVDKEEFNKIWKDGLNLMMKLKILEVVEEHGIEQGLEQGKEEVALNMLTEGISDKIILKTTKISQDTLQKLKMKLAQ